MKNTKSVTVLSDSACSFIGRRVILLTAVACLIHSLLFVLHQIFLANFGSSSVISVFTLYFMQIFTSCAIFSLAGLAAYALFIGNKHMFYSALAWQCASSLFISVLLESILLLALAKLDSTDFVINSSFSLSNFTIAQVNESEFVNKMLMSLSSFLIVFIIIVLSMLIASGEKKKMLAQKTDLTPSALACRAEEEGNANPLILPINTFTAVFAAVSLISAVADTVNTVLNFGTPDSYSGYSDLVLPYIMVLICTVSGYLAARLITHLTASRALDLSSEQ